MANLDRQHKHAVSTYKVPTQIMHSFPRLPAELWNLVAEQHRGVWTVMLRTCRATRDAALECIAARHGLSRQQAMTYARVVHLRQSLHVQGRVGAGKSTLLRSICARLKLHANSAESMAVVSATHAVETTLALNSTNEIKVLPVAQLFALQQRKRRPSAPQAVNESASTRRGATRVIPFRREYETDAELEHLCTTAVLTSATRRRLRLVQLLVIDDAHALGDELYSLIDCALRLAHHDSRNPFARVQVVTFSQLSPPAPSRADCWCQTFEARIWQLLPTTILKPGTRSGPPAAG